MRAGRFVVAAITGLMSAAAWGQVPATGPAGRTMQDVGKDLQAATGELKKVIGAPTDLLDPVKRTAIAPNAIPVIKRIEGLMTEMGTVAPQLAQQVTPRRLQLVAMRAVLGDAGAEATLTDATKSSDPMTAVSGKTALLTADWVRTAQDPVAQGKVLDRSEALVKESPENVGVGMLLASYVQFGSASPANKERAISIIQKELKGPVGDDLREQLAKRAAATKPGL